MDTNKLTKEINDILHPRVALIAYASREGESFFVEAREIDGKGKMGEGVLLAVRLYSQLMTQKLGMQRARRLFLFVLRLLPKTLQV